jgi:conjugal transfer mating pair stabilization protein TraG
MTVSGSTESEGERVGELQQIAKNVSKATGATEQQVAAVAFGGSAHFGGGIPSAISPVDAGALISATGRKSYSASIQQQDQLITNALSSEDKAKFKAFADTVTKNTGMVDSLVSDSRNGHELSARLARSVTRSERADANLRNQIEFSESVSGAYQRGESISKDVAKDPRNIKMFEDLLRLEHAGSAAELIKMESYIGNITSVPHQLSASSSLPQSFDDVHNAHKRNVDQLPADTVSDQFKKDGFQIKDGKSGPSSSRTPSHPYQSASIRLEVAKAGDGTKDSVRDAESAFRSKAGVEIDKNGHIYTHRSLFGDANEQVKSDPDVVAEKAKELALRLAKMAKKGE